jgi:hypothetical protein
MDSIIDETEIINLVAIASTKETGWVRLIGGIFVKYLEGKATYAVWQVGENWVRRTPKATYHSGSCYNDNDEVFSTLQAELTLGTNF